MLHPDVTAMDKEVGEEGPVSFPQRGQVREVVPSIRFGQRRKGYTGGKLLLELWHPVLQKQFFVHRRKLEREILSAITNAGRGNARKLAASLEPYELLKVTEKLKEGNLAAPGVISNLDILGQSFCNLVF